ncbi:MAG: hypothetical protein ACD_39C00934G0002 [uncultured bacterium]|nr:MAG: hypothetical protein ACD_39C00934G0002 [uncultured bacterium]
MLFVASGQKHDIVNLQREIARRIKSSDKSGFDQQKRLYFTAKILQKQVLYAGKVDKHQLTQRALPDQLIFMKQERLDIF